MAAPLCGLFLTGVRGDPDAPRPDDGEAGNAARTPCAPRHLYPAHAAFGGYKVSGVGRENHKMMLDHYTQTKCLLVSYDPKPLGLF